MRRSIKTGISFMIILLSLIVMPPKTKEKDFTKETETTEKINPRFDNYSLYLEELKKIEVDFRNANTYLNEEELRKILETDLTLLECDGEITDYRSLSDIIIENSILGNSQNNPFYHASDKITGEKNLEDRLFREALKKALDIVFEKNENPKDDICVLKDIKIALGSTGNFSAIVFDRNTSTLIIDYTQCVREFLSKTLKNSDREWSEESDYLAALIASQFNKIRTEACSCQKEKGQQLTSVQIDVALSNILDISSITQVEDYLAGNQINIPDFYSWSTDKKESQRMLLLKAAFKEDRNLDNYYNSIFSADLQKLHAFFGLKDENDIIEFYKTAYALDVRASSDEALKKVYDELGYIPMLRSEINQFIGNACYLSIFKTAVGDIITRINEDKTYTVEEGLYLYNIAKSMTVTEAGSLILTPLEGFGNVFWYDESFLSGVDAIDRVFYRFLSEAYSIKEQDLKDIASSISASGSDAVDLFKLQNRFPLLNDIMREADINFDSIKDFKDKVETFKDYRWKLDGVEKGRALKPIQNKINS